MKLILITDEGIERRECSKIEPSLKPGYLVIDDEYSVNVVNIMCIVDDHIRYKVVKAKLSSAYGKMDREGN